MNRELRSLIVGTILTHPNAAPEEIAQLVANNVHHADMRTYLRDLLVAPARTLAAEQRRQQQPPRPKPQPKPRPAADTTAENPPVPPAPQPSVKLADRRTWWQQQLASEIRVGGGVMKPLADCTADDLRLAVKEIDAAVGRFEERMSLLNRLISQMVTTRVQRVRDLPEQQPQRMHNGRPA